MTPSSPTTSRAILEAITSEQYRLRWPVGNDARGFYQARTKVSDEDWVAMGEDLSDQEYNQRFFEYFDIRL